MTPIPDPTPTATPDRPLVSMLLIAYCQAGTVRDAIAGALAQTYSPLEILISDDASHDDTWAVIEAAVTGYCGPHRLVLNRNLVNLGIGAHLSKLVEMSQGELLFVTAGDDVSLPQRCDHTVRAWMAQRKEPDLIACALLELDKQGAQRGLLRPTDLSRYRGATDWLAHPPRVVGAGQAWTRRLFQRFGPLPAGTVAEDLIMVFRAIVSGGALTLDEALVEYGPDGISRRRRALHASDVRARLASNARHSLVELPCLLRDAALAGVSAEVAPALRQQLAREQHVAAQLTDGSLTERLHRLWADAAVPVSLRLRVFVYAACPGLLAPSFALKRAALRWRGTLT